ncbi:hypothetical protein CDD81_2837 [Ophiocordyceps australis]|uniref:Secreted protein n=1 Tax=Ophiocordyceps australis TaxID=1399860 RepID=A0A2C5X7F8_9HYPO|nr:hypothetical protein CDD81_2837 [Ophiocordyceps australis]
MIFPKVIALAISSLSLVLAAGNYCFSLDGSECQWTSCLDQSAPEPEYNRKLTSTVESSYAEVCSTNYEDYPGPHCCNNYGSRCVIGGSTLWCKAAPQEPDANKSGDIIGKEWVGTNKQYNEWCKKLGGIPTKTGKSPQPELIPYKCV